jgi:hypothetical protein
MLDRGLGLPGDLLGDLPDTPGQEVDRVRKNMDVVVGFSSGRYRLDMKFDIGKHPSDRFEIHG